MSRRQLWKAQLPEVLKLNVELRGISAATQILVLIIEVLPEIKLIEK